MMTAETRTQVHLTPKPWLSSILSTASQPNAGQILQKLTVQEVQSISE